MRKSWFAVLLMALLGTIEASSQSAGPRGASRLDPGLRAVLAAEESRAGTPEQLRHLVDATRAASPSVQAAAARALGRLERRDVITTLIPLLPARDVGV